MSESLPLLLLTLIALAAAGWFAYRSARLAPLEAERDRALSELGALRQENARLSSELATERGASTGRAEADEKRFVALAAQALDMTQQRFMALANETFEKHRQAAQGSVKEVLTPTQEQLAKLALSVDALDKARLQDKSTLEEQVRQIVGAVGSTNRTTQQLLTALKASPKMRGRWGEQTLRNVLELSGLAQHVDFTEQVSTTDGEGARLRPDVLINLPGGRCIVVDSKVALTGYMEAMEAVDDAAREASLKKHAGELKAHVKNLASKDYWKHVPATADFVVLFVPGENFLAAAAERDPNLFDDAFASKVIITTPSTMVALAKSVAYGWRQEQAAQNAQEIAELGRELYRRMGGLVEKVSKLGGAIEGSVKAYGELVATTEARLLPQTRKFKDLGASDSDELASLKQVEATVRQIAPPELDLSPPPASGAKRSR